VEERLERIETKIAFTEDLVEELNLTVFRQQEQIDRLREQIARLTDLLGDLSVSRQRDPRDEMPPHY